MDSSGVRLNKFLATHLSIGRRQADDLIAKGKVLLNGEPAGLGARVRPGDNVYAGDKRLTLGNTPDYVYIIMNKPKGYVCSRRQQGEAQTVYSILPPEYRDLKTVGRLDKNSSGLILLTNNGDFAHKLTHPSFAKTKEYEVGLNKPLEPLHHQMINDHGITLPDGPSKLGLQRQKEGNAYDWIVIMHEGRNRQIRRTFEALGYNVTRLHRTKFGGYSIGGLKSGEARPVSPSL